MFQYLEVKVLAEVAPLGRGGSGSESVGLGVADNCAAGVSAAVIESVGCGCAVGVIGG